MMPVRRWHQWCPNRYATLCMMYAISIADRWDRYISTHTKARKQLLKSNRRMPCLRREKGSSFEVFSLLQRDQLWESFLWQSGRLPTRKRQTLLFLLLVKELKMACMRKTYIIFAHASWYVHYFFVWNTCFFFLLDVSRTWSISRCRKNWRSPSVTLNTLYCVCGS